MADIKKLIEQAVILEGLLRNIEAQNGRQFPEYLSLLNEKFEEFQQTYYEMFPPNKLINENHNEDEDEIVEIVDVDEEETPQNETPAPQSQQQQWRTNTVPLSKPQSFPTPPIAHDEAPQQPLHQTPMPQQMPPQQFRQTPMPQQQMPPQQFRQTPMPQQQMPPQPLHQTPMPQPQMPPQPLRQTPMPQPQQQMPPQPLRQTPMPQPQMPANMHGSQPQPQRVDEVLSQRKAENLSKAFTINDKYRFGRDLYYSNNELMNEQIKAAQDFSNYQQAYDLFVVGNKWNPENPIVQEFMAIISRHFQQQ